MKKSIFVFMVIAALALPAVWSLFHGGFFPSHDGEWMVIRLSDFHRSFVSGQIPVRWASRLNHNYGYPVFNFLYPLPFYLGEFFHLLGFSFVGSIKIVFILSFLLSAIFMYVFARELWGKWGGAVSAIFYVYAPYRFLDVYVRGSIGEAVGFALIPLIFWAMVKLRKSKSWLFVSLGALVLAGLIMSHNIMAMLFGPIVLLAMLLAGYLTAPSRRKIITNYYLLITVFSFGLSCFFWLPALYDKQFIILDQVTVANFWEHFPSLNQLFVPSWGYGPSTVDKGDQVSYQLGLIHLLAVFLSVVVLARSKGPDRPKKHQILFYLFVFLGGLFFMLPASTFFWRMVPMLWRAQFPWRFLSITTFASAVLAGSAVELFKPRFRAVVAGGLIAAVVAVNYVYAKPEEFVDREEGFYTTNEATTTVKDEYMPVWVKEKPVKRADERVEAISGESIISHISFNSRKVNFNVEAKTESEIQINSVYFPGWKLKVDDQPTTVLYRNRVGLMRFKVGPGRHQVAAEFGETPLRLFADAVSLGSLILIGSVVILIPISRRKKNLPHS